MSFVVPFHVLSRTTVIDQIFQYPSHHSSDVEIYEKFFRWQTVSKWIRKIGVNLETKLGQGKEKGGKGSKDIQILEMGELYTYVRKKVIRPGYGLLLTGKECVLVNLRLDGVV
jgi:hypothetical protein